MPEGRVTFERRSMLAFSHWQTLSGPITDLIINSEGRIEDTPGTDHAMVRFQCEIILLVVYIFNIVSLIVRSTSPTSTSEAE